MKNLIIRNITGKWLSIEILTICFIIIFASYNKVLNETKKSTALAADSICEIYMHDTATLMESYLQTSLSSFFREMKSAYDTFIIDSPKSKEEYDLFFDYLATGKHREYYALIDNKGNLYTKDGINPKGKDLSFFYKIKGKNDRIITVSDEDLNLLEINNDSTIIIASAVENYIFNNTTIIGIVSAVDFDYLRIRMNMEATNQKSFYSASIIKTNGDYIIHNPPFEQTKNYNNFFEAFEENVRPEKNTSVYNIKYDFLMKNSGFTTFSVFGQKSYLYYMPIKFTDLYLAVYMPYQAMENTISDLNKRNTVEFIKLIIVCVLLIFIGWFIYAIQEKYARNKLLIATKEATEAKQEADKANKAKTDFLSHISHDIRTPLNGIIGMTNIAIDGTDYSDRVKECLNDISISSDYLLTLISDVLDMNKIESGKMDVKNNDFNLYDLNNECFKILQELSISKDININFNNISPDIYVYSDKIKIKQILINILSNSVKYTLNNGHINFYCKIEYIDSDNINVIYTIQDNGIGMSEEFMSKLFEPFVQENNEYHSCYNGSGLGMAIVKNLIALLNGTISVKSKINKGTEVIVSLKLKAIDTKHYDNKISQANDINISLKNKKILIVEDNDINLKIAVHLISSVGKFEIITAHNGQEAVNIFENSSINEFSYIFMDIMMPILDGFEASKIIRNMYRPDAKSIPIIAMTANAFTESVSKSQEAGMTEYITKPIDKNSIHQIIMKYSNNI